ncbi:maleylpyruvate isomerase family mycothiol-dependent enzyme [Nocardioides sp. LHG3406-4]|uniref:maleylpyruvate isomerase family mycothiol-dependent enzyme n=1 Tax=Nocardioides sp. LHG3406-4 TaxID=2804575 RepID=UPI003CECB45B
MTRLEFDAYLDHIRRDSARFGEVLATCDPAASVPACPEWDAADLLWHLTGVQWFWSRIVQGAADPEAVQERERPAAYADLLDLYAECSAALIDALALADPAGPAWTWSQEQTVGFIFRRQAHEALIHRLDAEQTAGDVTDLDAQLAADGVQETLDVMFGGTPAWGTFTPGEQVLRVDCIDTDDHVWVRLGVFAGTDPGSGTTYADEADISVIDDPGGEPDCLISGPAAALDAWLWRRAGDDEIDVTGDRTVYDAFRAIVDQPIN